MVDELFNNKDIVNEISLLSNELSGEILDFFRRLVKTKSYTGEEEEIAKIIHDKMLELDYDKVWQDKLGNVIGQIGNGETIIYFDSHMDTVGVNNPNEWITDPFSAEVKDGEVYGRGSADMKSGLAASIYAGAMLKMLGLAKDKTIYIAATVMEEDLDGIATLELLESLDSKPQYAIICEPTSLDIGIGHKGRALTKITVKGKAAHGSRPDLGINPTYALAEVLGRVYKWGKELMADGIENSTVAVTSIESISDSFNSIPKSAALYIDHRFSLNENEVLFESAMNNLISGIDAKWEICDFSATTWTGQQVTLHSMHPAWEIDKEHDLAVNAILACQQMGRESTQTLKLGFSTNAVATAGRWKIPTIVIGPGDVRFAHMTNEHCSIIELIDACKIYTCMCHLLP